MDYHVDFPAGDLVIPPDVAATEIEGEIYDWICGPDGVVARAFTAHGYPLPWAPLKPSTVKDKLRKGYSPLADQFRTGKLWMDATHPSLERGQGCITLRIDAGRNKYAAAHQYGSMGTQRRQLTAWLGATARRRSNKKPVVIGQQMPPRPPLPTPSVEWCALEAQKLADMLLHMEGFA